MARARIVIADDHTLVVEGFRRLLEPHFDVVGAVEDGRALLEAAELWRPDVIVLDISMPLLNGIDAARQLVRRVPDVKLVFLSMHTEPIYVREAFKAGARAYLVKRSAASELVFALHQVLAGRTYLTPLVTGDVVSGMLSASTAAEGARADCAPRELTQRQREVLQLVAEGKSVKQIAAILNIAPKTAEFHKTRLMHELGLHTTAELTRYAVAQGLVSL